MKKYNLTKEANETDAVLAGDIKKLEVLSEEKIKELLPKRVDQEELNELIKAVNEAKSENEKKTVLIERLGKVSQIVKDVVINTIK